jgi:hypothetical protein
VWWRVEAGGSGPCREIRGVHVVVRVAGSVKLRCGDGGVVLGFLLAQLLLLLARLFPFSPSSPLSSPRATAAGRRLGFAWLGFLGAATGGFLWVAALGFAARARAPRAVMPGVRATATRRASGGCSEG